MVESRIVPPPAGCPLNLTPDMVSADAWAAVRILGVLARGAATGGEVEDHLALDALTVLPLLEILEAEGLVRRGRDRCYRLATAAAAISIAAIVRAVDGDTLRATVADDDAPEIMEIQRRITVTAADILDNFSLAEAVADGSDQLPGIGTFFA